MISIDRLPGFLQVRSSKQDQIHNSIVSTLLALMDGLDSRGQVVVIGATNRLDALDGALRRPGRYGTAVISEHFFSMPDQSSSNLFKDVALAASTLDVTLLHGCSDLFMMTK